MSDVVSEARTLSRFAGLSRIGQADSAKLKPATPDEPDAGAQFRPADIMLLDQLCNLSELCNLDPEALAMLIAVIERMQDARRDLHALLGAIGREAPDIQARLGAALARSQIREGT